MTSLSSKVAKALVVLFVLTCALAIPNVALLLLFLTLGIGLPITFAPTALVYLACLFPVAVAIESGRRASLLVAVPLSALLVASAALIPHWLGERIATQAQLAMSLADIKPSLPQVARSIEYRRTTPLRSDLAGKVFSDSVCDRYCTALLVGGEIDWVRVVIERSEKQRSRKGDDAREESPAFLTAGKGTACGVADPLRKCAVFAPDDGAPADLIVTIAENRLTKDWQPQPTHVAQAWGTRRVDVHHRDANGLRQVLRHTEVQFAIASRPATLVPHMSDTHSSGFELLTLRERFNPITHDTLLKELGFTLTALVEPARPANPTWRDEPSAEQSARVLSILTLPQDQTLTAEQGREIGIWVAHARQYANWTDERVALLRTVIRDPRVRTGFMLDQILTKNPSVLSKLMGDILDAAEVSGLGYDRIATQAFYAMQRIDSSLLHPWRDRILGLVGSGGTTRIVALPLVGRLGVDPTPFIKLSAGARETPENAAMIRAACYADDMWSARIIGLLRTYVQNLRHPAGRPARAPEDALKALMRHGDTAYVEYLLGTRGWADAGQIHRQLFGGRKRPGSSQRFC